MPPPRSYLDRSARRLGAASRQSPQAWVASSTSIRPPGSKAILKGGPLRWGRITAFTHAFRRWAGMTPSSWRQGNHSETKREEHQ
ncbi:hypothetical protein BV511_01980 [Methylorubrum extorquens]|nr:hypothetical protein BV511_01980 [Methylorubrum extorquens]